jgi:exodeoxyribonuclease V alpha subunit
LPWVEKRIGLALAETQVVAIRLALISKVLVMTGGPGVGNPAHPRGERHGPSAVRANRPRCEAHD